MAQQQPFKTLLVSYLLCEVLVILLFPQFIYYPNFNFILVYITFNKNNMQNDFECISLGFVRTQWNLLEKGMLLLVHGDFFENSQSSLNSSPCLQFHLIRYMTT